MSLTWTYAANRELARDRIRQLIGDVRDANPLVYDEEIAGHVSGDDQDTAADALAASELALMIAGNFAAGVYSMSSGDDSINFGSQKDRADFYLARSKVLAAQAAAASGSSPVPFLGGSSVVDKAAREADSDRVRPSFSRSQTDGVFGRDRYGDWS